MLLLKRQKENKRLYSGTLPQNPQWPWLGQAEAGSQEVHLGSPSRVAGTRLLEPSSAPAQDAGDVGGTGRASYLAVKSVSFTWLWKIGSF